EVMAGAGEPGLDFIGDAHAAGGAHVFVGVLEVAVRKYYRPAHTLDGLGDEPGNLSRRGVVNNALDVGGVFAAGVRIVAAPLAAVGVSVDGVMNAEAVGHVEFPGAVGGQAHGGHVPTMIAIA